MDVLSIVATNDAALRLVTRAADVAAQNDGAIGLSLGSVLDDAILLRTLHADADRDRVTSPNARLVLNKWHAHGFTIDQILILTQGIYTRDELDSHFSGRGVKWDEQEAVRLHHAGWFLTDIAKQLGVPRQTVNDAFVRLGIEPKLMRRSPAASDRADVLAMRARGLLQGEIREATGLPLNTIKSILRQARSRPSSEVHAER